MTFSNLGTSLCYRDGYKKIHYVPNQVWLSLIHNHWVHIPCSYNTRIYLPLLQTRFSYHLQSVSLWQKFSHLYFVLLALDSTNSTSLSILPLLYHHLIIRNGHSTLEAFELSFYSMRRPLHWPFPGDNQSRSHNLLSIPSFSIVSS